MDAKYLKWSVIVAVCMVFFGEMSKLAATGASWGGMLTMGFIAGLGLQCVGAAQAILVAYKILPNGKNGNGNGTVSASAIRNLTKPSVVLLAGTLGLGALATPACALFQKQATVTQQQQKLTDLAIAADRLNDVGIVAREALKLEISAAQAGVIPQATDRMIRQGFERVAQVTRTAIAQMKDLTVTDAARRESVRAIIVALDDLIQKDIIAITDQNTRAVILAVLNSMRPILETLLPLV